MSSWPGTNATCVATELLRDEFRAVSVVKPFEDCGRQPFTSRDGRYSGLAQGEVYELPDGEVSLEGLFRYAVEGDFRDLERVNGQFLLVVHDAHAGQVIVVNDRFGFWPLFYRIEGEATLLSSRIRDLLVLSGTGGSFDAEGVASLMFFGHHFGDATLFKDVACLPPACVARFGGGRAEIQRYWRIEYAADPGLSAEHLGAELTAAVRRQSRSGRRVGVLLSGGLDSRVVVHEAAQVRDDLRAFTFGNERSMDVVFGRQVAEELGVDWVHLPFEPAVWKSSLPGVALQVEGEADIQHFRSGQFHPTMKQYADVLLTGLSGDMVMGSFVKADHVRPMAHAELAAYGFTSSLQHDLAALARLFDPTRFESMVEALRARVVDSIEVRPGELGADVLSRWNIENRQRRFIFMGLVSDRYLFTARSPFYDYELFDCALRIPAQLRRGEALYARALWNMMPGLRHVPWQKTGLPPDPNRLRHRSRQLLRAAARRLPVWRSVESAPSQSFISLLELQRMAFGKTELVEGLTSGAPTWHEWIRPDAIRELVDEQFERGQNHATILSKLMTLQLTEQLVLRGGATSGSA